MKQVVSAPDIANTLKCELASEVLHAFGPVRFPAIGRSMLPAVWPGDTLVVERVIPDQVQVGDVVVVGRHGSLCAHRVISAGGDAANPQWITQGDALLAPDWPVSEKELLGRVAYLIRRGKLIEVPAELSVAKRWIAKIVRRSVLAARGLVFLHRVVQDPKESVPCQG